MPPFIQNLLALPAKTKAILGVSFVAIIAIAFIMLKIATAPSYSLIASGLDPAADRQDHRRARRAGHRLRAAQQRHGARRHRRRRWRRRASRSPPQGVQATGGAQPGYELLDESKLGASQFQQQVTYQRALEGEIARTLSGVQGVSNPTVQIVMPAGRPLPGRGDAGHGRDPARQLRRHAGARRRARHGADRRRLREGPEVRERHHHRLHRRDPVAVRRGRRHRRLEQGRAEARYAPPDGELDQRDARFDARPDKAQVKINADLNVDKSTTEELTYGKTGVPITESYDERDDEGLLRATSGGTSGTGSNVPTYSAARAARPRAPATTTTRRSTPTSASTRRSPRPRRRRARSTSSRSP